MSAMPSEAAPRGHMVEIGGGRRMRLVREGPPAGARPTVLLEAGSFGFAADWAAVQDELAAAGLPSIAYDRAGLGYSDPGPAPRDSRAISADLAALLNSADEPGPFILCGHSMAGLHVRVFAAENAPRVVGVVLVDATTPEAMDEPVARQFVGGFERLSRLAAWGANVGLQRPLAGAFGDMIGLSAAAKAEKRWAFADAGHNHRAADEVEAWLADAEQGVAAGPYDPAWPVAVVLAGDQAQGLEGEPGLFREAPARLSRQGFVVRVAGANHATLLGLAFAGRIAEAILEVEAAASA
jgi:pimeloyl-ACP methyl ester carboxylesterase